MLKHKGCGDCKMPSLLQPHANYKPSREVWVFCPLVHTSRHFLHEDLDETILADGAQVLHDVPVFQPLVQSDLLVEGLRIPWRDKQEL